MTLEEMQARLAAINNELETATGERLAELETEARSLMDNISAITQEAQRRQQLRTSIAAGLTPAQVVEQNGTNPQHQGGSYDASSPEYRSAFLKHLRGESMTNAELRAFTFLTANTTAVLPTVMQNRIIDLISEAHPIVADVYPLRSGTAITIPVAKSVKSDADVTEEGAAAAELEIEMGEVTLSGEDYTANVKMSYKMQYMAIDAFEDYLVTQISERLGAQLAAGIIAKIKATIHADNKIATGVTYEGVCAGFGELKRVGTVVVYGTRKGVYNKLIGMVDDNGRPIFQQVITAGAAGALLGAVIKFEDAVGDTELLIGDPKKFVQNEVAPVIIENAKDLENHKVVFSGYTCQEGALTDDKAFAIVSESAS